MDSLSALIIDIKMIILAWNIRGLGSRIKRRELRNLVRMTRTDFLIIVETKTHSFSFTLLRTIGGGRLNSWEFLPLQGQSSGILMSWAALYLPK